MFELKSSGFLTRRTRLLAPAKLSSDDFDAIAVALRTKPKRARKIGMVSARQSTARQTIETHWNGKETHNEAQPGDWIVTNLAPDAQPLRDQQGNTNTYVIRRDRFGELYAPTPEQPPPEQKPAAQPAPESTGDGALYRAISEVDALYLSGGFELMAPWGEIQSAPAGYLIRNGPEIYGNNKETFLATYALIDRP